jgi:predicted methyltransferase
VSLVERVGQVRRVGQVGLVKQAMSIRASRTGAVGIGLCIAVSITVAVPDAAAQRRGRPEGFPPPSLLIPPARPAPPVRPPQPNPPVQGASPADPADNAKNRLFPAQELGLIEPPDRDQWQPPEQIMDDLNIADGAVVADIGAGGGWFTIHLALRVGPRGTVYAEDVQQQMIDAIRRRAQRENLLNVRPLLGTATDPKLPRGLDAAIIVDGYHEIACAAKPSCNEPTALLASVARALKPQGRLGIVDFYPGGGGPGPASDERVDPDDVVKAAAAAGLQLITRKPLPPFRFQYLLVFGRAPAAHSVP